MDKEILILGIGNILQKDDGIGPYIINHIIQSNIKLPDNVDIIDGGTAGYDLLPLLQNRSKIIVVDALKVDDSPGGVYCFKPGNILEEERTFSLHDVGIKSILRMLEIMGELPEVEIIGIVPEDISTFEIGISASVEKSKKTRILSLILYRQY
jgi:hydrogenase maturation protease